MSLQSVIKNATRGVVPKIIASVANCTVTTTRQAKTRDDAARPVNTPSNPIIGAQWYIRQIAAGRVQYVWGQESSAAFEAQAPLESDVADNDVVVITAGDFAGTVVEVEQARLDTFGNRLVIALAPTQKAPHTPGP